MRLILAISCIVFFACDSRLSDPQKIVDKAIEFAGGDKFLNCRIEFDFRDRHYVTTRKGGLFTYERILKQDSVTTHDFLTNDGFRREINNNLVTIPDSMAAKYTSSVNSVIYFALLPFGLNDPAVFKKFLGETEIDNQPYYKIEITFNEEGGGEDYEDVFHYWIHQETFAVDYFSYVYHSDGGGIRFREAIKQHRNNGILLQDYINYEPVEDAKLNELQSLYSNNKLKELSKIELRNITVEVFSDP